MIFGLYSEFSIREDHKESYPHQVQSLPRITVKLRFRLCKNPTLLRFWDTRLIQILPQKPENIFT